MTLTLIWMQLLRCNETDKVNLKCRNHCFSLFPPSKFDFIYCKALLNFVAEVSKSISVDAALPVSSPQSEADVSTSQSRLLHHVIEQLWMAFVESVHMFPAPFRQAALLLRRELLILLPIGKHHSLL
jgi:hypothetical protein